MTVDDNRNTDLSIHVVAQQLTSMIFSALTLNLVWIFTAMYLYTC